MLLSTNHITIYLKDIELYIKKTRSEYYERKSQKTSKFYSPSNDADYAAGIGGDQGILARSELRWLMNPLQSPMKYYLGAFYDIGSVQYNRNNVYAGIDNRETVKGAGLGLLITHKNNLSVRLDYAWKICGLKAEDGNNGRFWGQLIYSY